MKPARTRDDPVYGDYPALYALGVAIPIPTVRRRTWPGWVLAGLVVVAIGVGYWAAIN